MDHQYLGHDSRNPQDMPGVAVLVNDEPCPGSANELGEEEQGNGKPNECILLQRCNTQSFTYYMVQTQ
jgi:hypothetical protein